MLVDGQRFGSVLIGMRPSRLDNGAGRPGRDSGRGRGRQRVFHVVVVIVEAIPEAVLKAIREAVVEAICGTGSHTNSPRRRVEAIRAAGCRITGTAAQPLIVGGSRTGETDHE